MTHAKFHHTSLVTAALLTLAMALPANAQRNALSKANDAAIRAASDASLVGALHEFAYERGALYAIDASPQRITDLALEPGEILLSVSAGDTTRWIVADARSGNATTGQAHVLVKPNAPNLSTNLVVMTDRRVYHLELKSVAGPAMAAVSWRYPADMLLASRPPPPAPKPEPTFEPAKLNLRYRITGSKPAWRPLAAFDDGRQVFIEMPPAVQKLEAPPLFIIGPEGQELTNYRQQGAYYIVDRLFEKAEMRIGSGKTISKVRIERTTPIAGGYDG